MENIPSFLKRKEDSILFNGDGEFIFYVPEYLFTSKNAVTAGEYVTLLGLLNYVIVDGNDKKGPLKRFKFPTMFLTKPSYIDKMKNVKLTEYTEAQDYSLLHYKKNDQIVVSTSIPQDIGNLERFINLFSNGHLPTTIPYDKIQEYFTECINLNGASFGVTLQLIGIIISEVCRDSNDLSKTFRLGKDKNMTDYRALALTTIPKYVSPSAAITSENWNEAIVGAIMNKKEIDSPMEKMLMR